MQTRGRDRPAGGCRSRSRRQSRPPAAGDSLAAAGRPLPAASGSGIAKKLQDFLDRSQNPEGNAGFAAPGGRRRGPDRVGRGGVRGRGFSGHGAFARRDTLESKAVRRPRLNSTLKSLLFWMVLVVVGVLIWNFSTIFAGKSETPMPFSEFLKQVEAATVLDVTITGNEITGTLDRHDRQRARQVPHLRAPHYEGLAQQTRRERHRRSRPSPRRRVRGRRCSIPGRRSC